MKILLDDWTLQSGIVIALIFIGEYHVCTYVRIYDRPYFFQAQRPEKEDNFRAGNLEAANALFYCKLTIWGSKSWWHYSRNWGIENRLHWQLDVTYREDYSRVRKGNGAENLAVLRRATMNILRSDQASKISFKRRRLRASLKRDYLCELMGVK